MGLLFLEEHVDLLAGRAVNPGIGEAGLPVEQMLVLLGETAEGVALQGVALDVVYPLFDLPLVPRHSGLGGQDHRAVVLTERFDLWMYVRIIPVRLLDGRLEVV